MNGKDIRKTLNDVKKTMAEAHELVSSHNIKDFDEISPEVRDELKRIFERAIKS